MAEVSDQSAAPSRRLPLWVTLVVWLMVLGVVFYFWAAFSLVFLLLLAAAAVAGLLRPLSRKVSSNPARGGLVVGLGFWMVFAGLIVLLVWLLYEPVAEQLARWPETEQSINEALQAWAGWFGIETDITLRMLLLGTLEWLGGEGGPDMDLLASIADSLGVGVVTLVVLVFGSVFLLIEPPGRLTGPLARLLPDDYRKTVRAVSGEIDYQLRWWLAGILVSMVAVGTFAGFGFWLVGLDFWLPLGLFAGLAEVVPFLGPTFAFLVALLFAMTHGTGEVIGVLVVWGVIQMLESYVLVPLVMRKAVRMPPVVTLFTLVLWGRVFGPLGLLLAIPINVVIWAFVSNFVLRRREEERQAEQNKGPPR